MRLKANQMSLHVKSPGANVWQQPLKRSKYSSCKLERCLWVLNFRTVSKRHGRTNKRKTIPGYQKYTLAFPGKMTQSKTAVPSSPNTHTHTHFPPHVPSAASQALKNEERTELWILQILPRQFHSPWFSKVDLAKFG